MTGDRRGWGNIVLDAEVHNRLYNKKNNEYKLRCISNLCPRGKYLRPSVT